MNLTLGVEIEGGGVPRETVARALSSALGAPPLKGRKQRSHQTYSVGGYAITYDPSLKSWDGDRRVEIASPVFSDREDLRTRLPIVLATLRDVGLQQTEVCGTHIHVGGLSLSQALSLARVAVTEETPLIARAHKRRRKFCKPVRESVARLPLDSTPEEVRAAAGDKTPQARLMHYVPWRHRGLNLHSFLYRGTVEFRYFNGTLSQEVLDGEYLEEVYRWLYLAL